jgi:hypothetical protein
VQFDYDALGKEMLATRRYKTQAYSVGLHRQGGAVDINAPIGTLTN